MVWWGVYGENVGEGEGLEEGRGGDVVRVWRKIDCLEWGLGAGHLAGLLKVKVREGSAGEQRVAFDDENSIESSDG